ncbi:MAG: EAL domain-containing protein [Angelakisella sp.]
MKTIAEGVETQSQLDFLKTAGCDIVQGYFWAKPMPVSDFEQLMIDAECVKTR